MDTTINVFNEISIRIIKEQEAIIGPLAWAEASKVSGFEVIDADKKIVNIKAEDPREVVNALVARYEKLFGRLSRDVSRQAVSDLTADIPNEDIPASLK
ncbi:MAG: hypothetical protein WCO65_00710 [bacterium]